MAKVSWTPNMAGAILLIWASLWLGSRYLVILKKTTFIHDLLKIGIWAMLFIATPFLIWWLVEFLAEKILSIKWNLKK